MGLWVTAKTQRAVALTTTCPAGTGIGRVSREDTQTLLQGPVFLPHFPLCPEFPGCECSQSQTLQDSPLPRPLGWDDPLH